MVKEFQQAGHENVHVEAVRVVLQDAHVNEKPLKGGETLVKNSLGCNTLMSRVSL